MARWKELLVAHRVVEAGRRRKCYRCGEQSVKKGDTLVEIKSGMSWNGYCLACARGIVNRAEQKLAELKKVMAIGEEGVEAMK